MNLRMIAQQLGWRVWCQRVLASLVTVALLLPVPAFALTFLGSWSIVQSQTGGAPAGITGSVDDPTGGMLSINMGAYAAAVDATSKVTATRDFNILSNVNGGETVNIRKMFETLLQDATLSVKITLQPLTSSGTAFAISPVTGSAGSSPMVISHDTTDTKFMRPGRYRVIVEVFHTKKAVGQWSNSNYKFTFSGV